jgi:hypothetical protein
MKTLFSLITMICLTMLLATAVMADTSTPNAGPVIAGTGLTAETTPVMGFAPSVVGSVGRFYFNGDYSLANAGVFFGAAYTFADKTNNNVNSAGLYIGPSSGMKNGVTETTIDVMTYLNLFQTASYGSFGVGAGTRLWKSGDGFKGFSAATSFLALGYKF